MNICHAIGFCHAEESVTKVTFHMLTIPNDKGYKTPSALADTKDVTDFHLQVEI